MADSRQYTCWGEGVVPYREGDFVIRLQSTSLLIIMHKAQNSIIFHSFIFFSISLPLFSRNLENCNLSQLCYDRLIKNLASANSLD